MMIEKLNDKEAICITTLFIMGSTLIMGIGGRAENNSWISAILGMLFALPMVLIYSRIISIFKGKDLFEILELVFGKFIGKFIVVLYIGYSFLLGSLVVRNFGEFVDTLGMPETPMFVINFTLGLVCVNAVRLGIETIGRACAYFIPLVFFILINVQILAIPEFHFDYIKPIMYKGFMPVLQAGYYAFSFPFAETVILMSAFFTLKSKKSARKVYLWGLFLAGISIVVLTLRNVLILGNSIDMYYFPSYIAVGNISVGNFLQRLEVTVVFVFAIGAFAKSSMCLFSACRGFQRLFKLDDYRSVAIQVGLLMVYFSIIVYGNIMEMKEWAEIYSYYVIPVQIVIPVILWIVAEIRKKSILSSTNCA
ncbi:GerAB/ArcD/ProY family transporter [Acetivibrio clariflavus]|uniref:Spore germination protein, amino acid permease n=1 Tax=Acetivibrio clariflavus (strain DSM 19732 / NBRC 101661 / EBR45) TaxID=720554 RepID=G8LW89_ACECE|nr:endospore germination permease [Acetivibrio clariflavus]AEV69736.1 spore germination protein, amino acid permease [Acetivibrio clariflavus DSM 19732]